MDETKQKTYDPEILALAIDVGERYDGVDWQWYNDEEPAYRNLTTSEAFEIQGDFDKIAKADPQLAALVWENHVPSFVVRPYGLPKYEPEPEPANTIEPGRRRRKADPQAFLDPSEAIGSAGPKVQQATADTVDPATKEAGRPPAEEEQVGPQTSPASARDDQKAKAERAQMLLEGLERQYLKADDRYHFRDRGREVAFEAQEKKLVTAHDTPMVVNSMIDLAEAKGWSSLKLTGTNEFRREAWLQASVRDFEVSGYRPNAVDKARLEELRTERRASSAPEKPNVMADVPPASGRADKTPPRGFGPLKETETQEPPLTLTKPQDQAVGAMEVMMRSRGDSERAIAMARAELTERLRSDRVYVGKLVETGTAPYQDRPGEKPSHFVTLENDQGERTKVWGVDLPRAIEASGSQVGEKVALAFKGRQTVTVIDPIRDEADRVIRTEKKEVDRNTWEAVGFDRLRDVAKARVLEAAGRAAQPADLRVFDRTADRRQAPTVAVHRDRQSSKERVR